MQFYHYIYIPSECSYTAVTVCGVSVGGLSLDLSVNGLTGLFAAFLMKVNTNNKVINKIRWHALRNAVNNSFTEQPTNMRAFNNWPRLTQSFYQSKCKSYSFTNPKGLNRNRCHTLHNYTHAVMFLSFILDGTCPYVAIDPAAVIKGDVVKNRSILQLLLCALNGCHLLLYLNPRCFPAYAF